MLLESILLALTPLYLVLLCSVVHFVMPLNKSVKKVQERPIMCGFIIGIIIVSMVLNILGGEYHGFSVINLWAAILFLLVILICQILCLVQIIKKSRTGVPIREIELSDIEEQASWIYADTLGIMINSFKKNNADDRSYLKRVSLLIVPFVTAGFMYFIFGTYELYFSNMSEWKFIFSDIFAPSLLFFFIFSAIPFLIALVIKGKNLDRLTLIISALCVMSYIQYAFMNTNTFVSGDYLTTPVWIVLVNLLLWIAVPAALCIYYNKTGKKNIVRILSLASAAIIVIQGAALPVLLIDGLEEPQSRDYSGYTLDGSKQFEVSSEENVIVFIMDAFHSAYFTRLLEKEPEYYDKLSDFVFFDDANSEVAATTLSMPHILTAHGMDYSIPTYESAKRCWKSDEAEFFYSSLHDNGYKAELYSDSDVYYGGAEVMLGKIDNIKSYEFTYITEKIPTTLAFASLSAYRYFPHWLKEFVYISDVRYLNMYTTTDSIHENQNYASWEDISDSAKDRGIIYYNDDYYSELIKGLTTTEEKKCIFQHIHGMHMPYTSEVSDSVEFKDALDGCMIIFQEYIDQLKEIGVYDNSTIILTADHGINKKFQASSVLLVKPAGRTAERLEVNTAPANVQTDILPTILDCMGLPYEPLEYSVFDLEEDMVRTRYFRQVVFDGDYPKVNKVEGYGESIVNLCHEYSFTKKCLECTDEDCTFEEYPITDYWW